VEKTFGKKGGDEIDLIETLGTSKLEEEKNVLNDHPF
jgi:hypothetical protein